MGSVKKGKHVGIWGITSTAFVASTSGRSIREAWPATFRSISPPTSKPMGSRSSNFQPLSRGTRHKSLREAR